MIKSTTRRSQVCKLTPKFALQLLHVETSKHALEQFQPYLIFHRILEMSYPSWPKFIETSTRASKTKDASARLASAVAGGVAEEIGVSRLRRGVKDLD